MAESPNPNPSAVLEDAEMDTDDNDTEGSQPHTQTTVAGPSEFEMDSDEDDLLSTASELASPLPRPTINAHSFWSTLIPPSFLPRGSSDTRFRGGDHISKSLRIFSVALLPHPRPELENGGKIILPPSFLATITQRNNQLSGPMLFRVSNDSSKKITHCGVLEFIAEEGRCYMPYWRMHNIGANEGDMVTVEITTAPIGKFALFQPQSVDFLDISNPTALLENTLRNFACITKGEIIVIHYNNRVYELKVLDTKPSDVLNIIECDMDVDFAPAVGSPNEGSKDEVEEKTDEADIYSSAQPAFIPFVGTGCRLNGKPVAETPSNIIRHKAKGQPDFEWRVGTLRFIRQQRKIVPVISGRTPPDVPKDDGPHSAFKGLGVTLKGGNHGGI